MNDAEKKVIAQMLDELIREAAPESQTVDKYGGVLYTLKPDEKEGQFCGVFKQKNHVHLAFAQGSQLEDPKGILLGSGKYRRHLNFHSADDLCRETILGFLTQSIQLG